MTVNLPHPKTMPNGSILLLGISYPGLIEDKDKTRGREMPKVFTYALLKAGGVWYTSGSGKTPQGAGWSAVERWLERDNRVLEFIEVVSGTERVWTAPGEAVGNWHGEKTGREVVLSDDRIGGCLDESPGGFDDRTDR